MLDSQKKREQLNKISFVLVSDESRGLHELGKVSRQLPFWDLEF